MKLKEIHPDIYDVDAYLDECLGPEGSASRASSIEKAWEEYNAQILLDARKSAHLTQAELGKRIGADKGYISKVERGLIVPTVATLYRMAAAMGMVIELRPAPTLPA
ncbi:MAG: helix-turn-helix domain-containing protein [Bacteroidales bacterium]|nr:helix-turn-helix domain-containing protein [Bacteroidales bacterium]